MEWEQPHWSGRPDKKKPPPPKLRPNGFARMARFSVLNRHLILGIAALLIVICGGFAAVTLRADLDSGPRVTLDRTTADLQAELDQKFPNIEQTFLAIVESREADTARTQALALLSALKQRPDLFQQSFVPGAGDFYDDNGLLFASLDEVRARVDVVLQMQPLFQALAAAPDMLGLSALVAEIGRAVEQGRSPPGLEAVLFSAAASIESEVRGSARPIDWPALAGLKNGTQSLRWFVLAVPLTGLEADAAAFARQASAGMQGVSWVWPRRMMAGAPSPLRDFIVPGGLSVFMLMTILAAGLGSFRLTAALLVCSAATLAIAAGAAALTGRVLDSATWSFAVAALAPVLVTGTVLILGYDRARMRGLSAMQSVMLAAQQGGGLVSAVSFVFAAFWVSWLFRQLPSLGQFAIVALASTAAAWIVVTTLLPAVVAMFDADKPHVEPHWLDEALEGNDSPRSRNILDVATMLVLAAGIFSTVFLPSVRFGERHLPSSPAALLDTPDARGAVHLLVRPEDADAAVDLIAKIPEIGAIRTLAQFMPADVPAKIAELRRLGGFAAGDPLPRDPPDIVQLQTGFAELQEHLTAIASGPSTSEGLRDAALRLRRAVGLFAETDKLEPNRIEPLEQALFSELRDLSRLTLQLSALREPRFEDLSSELRQRFVAADGTWRIEVMPKPGIGVLSFAAAMRRVSPLAAGEPVAALVRNEIIHHETLLAIATAAVAAAVLVLAVLRNIVGAFASLVPVAAFVTLTAAGSTTLGLTLNAAMLAGASTIAAVLLSSSIIIVQHTLELAEDDVFGAGRAARTALVAPLALAGAVAPLAISPRPVFSDLGLFQAVLLLVSTLLCLLLVPAVLRWLGVKAPSLPPGRRA
jgi:uncharacterized protein